MYPEIYAELSAFVTVVLIDLVLAGDNAVVVGMAAAGLPPDLRRKAIVLGIAAAAVLRIIFALFTTQLLNIIGLVLVGGLLLLWVAWKLWRELRSESHLHAAAGAAALSGHDEIPGAAVKPKTMRQALFQIILADVSMSLDNVLAVAGTARHHLWVLVVGLALSVALMGLAATFIARWVKKAPWITSVVLALILWVALTMIWEGGHEVWRTAMAATPEAAPAH
jgi:YjbE family integral membrane protein